MVDSFSTKKFRTFDLSFLIWDLASSLSFESIWGNKIQSLKFKDLMSFTKYAASLKFEKMIRLLLLRLAKMNGKYESILKSKNIFFWFSSKGFFSENKWFLKSFKNLFLPIIFLRFKVLTHFFEPFWRNFKRSISSNSIKIYAS